MKKIEKAIITNNFGKSAIIVPSANNSEWEVLNREGLSIKTGFQEELLIITPKALKLMIKYRQIKNRTVESGGMLFAQLFHNKVIINKVTAPHKQDKRHRYFFGPSLQIQQSVINSEFEKGNHFIGEWHTHPEPIPYPSILDIKSMSKCFIKSRHQLRNLVLIILGTNNSIDSLWISLHNGKGFKRLPVL